MTDLTIFRTYEPFECGKDGYPIAWHDISAAYREQFERGLLAYNPEAFAGRGVKDLVREEAGHRCIRCGHPYVVGQSGIWEDAASERHPASPRLVEQLEGLELAAIDATEKVMRGKLWSPCDVRCTHGGPIRYRQYPAFTWREAVGDPTMRAISEAIESGMEVQAAWRILTVHHLNERKFDLRWHNLVSLCQRCHLTIQRKVEMNQVWPFEHSEWFKPYAAAFYAYSYLGEELTREETMGRLDRLLGLERVA